MKSRLFIHCTELLIGTNVLITNTHSNNIRNSYIRKHFIRNSIKSVIFFLLFSQVLWSQQVIEKEITDWEFRMVGDSVWKKAKVPGTIIDNFADLGDISNPNHPYYGDNEKLYQWIAEQDWEFRTTINEQVPSDYYLNGYVNIEFGCLDLFADVYINDQLYHHENALYPLQCGFVGVDVNKTTQTINADIRVVIHSTTKTLTKLSLSDSLKFPGGERVYARKPQYEFGWDWGPRFVNMGIRKPVKMWIHPAYSVNFKTILHQSQITNQQATLNFRFSTNYWMVKDFEMHLKVKLDSNVVYSDQKKISSDNTQGSFMEVKLAKPELWWPNGLNNGKSKYYTFEFSITEVGRNTVLHTNVFDVPLCDIQLVQKKDKQGESFYFTVNGKTVYAKGANYMPDDSFDPGKKTRDLVTLAANANMNMIRVWGGGTYPDNEFYNQCMKKGIMVWQDFMFACAMYPTSENYVTSYAYEGVTLSTRLNKYKNIAVWCGNNENEEGWFNWGWQKELKMSSTDSTTIWKNNKALFHDFYPGLLSVDYDNKSENADYIPTSPKHGWGRKESMTEGDSHYWGVWWGLEPIEKYNEKVPRFMSEFGMQSMPDLSTLKKVIPDSAMNFASPKFKNHQKHPTGFETLNHYLKDYLVVPENMEDYTYATQILQAYALTTAIEAQRRAMPYCMGSLIWQLNDCWPVTSWSLVDYELKKKIGYEEVKNAFDPLMISIKEESESYDIYLINDGYQTTQLEMRVYIKDFYGKVIWEKHLSKFKLFPNCSKTYLSIAKSSLVGLDLTTIYMYTSIQEAEKVKNKTYHFYRDKYFHFVRPGQLKLPAPQFKVERDNFGYVLLKTNVYCPYIVLPSSEGDNYLGPMQAGNKNIKSFGNDEYLNWLQQNTDKIKCLNTLLNH